MSESDEDISDDLGRKLSVDAIAGSRASVRIWEVETVSARRAARSRWGHRGEVFVWIWIVVEAASRSAEVGLGAEVVMDVRVEYGV